MKEQSKKESPYGEAWPMQNRIGKTNQELTVSIAIEAADTYRVTEHDAFTKIHRCYTCCSDYIVERFGTMMMPYLLTPANGRNDILFNITWG